MSKFAIAIALAGSVGIVAAFAAVPRTVTVAKSSPVVLELYQSQGCSSCPPANAVLNELAGRPDVIALSFAVTYWDQLGWKDNFAKPAFTARQWDYARAGGRSNVQTPQLIVDGRTALLGSRRAEVEAAIAAHRSAQGAPAITLAPGRANIGAGVGSATVWLAEYDPRTVLVPVRAGENGGRTLPHRNIVKSLTNLGRWSGKAQSYTLTPPRPSLSRVVLVQKDRGGSVLAASKI